MVHKWTSPTPLHMMSEFRESDCHGNVPGKAVSLGPLQDVSRQHSAACAVEHNAESSAKTLTLANICA
jgi:hypothetical protein